MLCEKCGKNPATFHYTEVVNGVKNEHHLCAECAANTDVSYYSNVFDSDMNITELLAGLLGGGHGAFAGSSSQDPATMVQCPRCGMTYGEFIKNSTFGCADCYDVFGPLITDTIRKLQGSDRHVGKKPMLYRNEKETTGPVENDAENCSEADEPYVKAELLSKRLKEAVAQEDFELAAKLRDEIAALRGKDGEHA